MEKAKTIAEQAAKEDKMVVDYLLVMLMQYIYADELDREDGQSWVRIVTGLDRRFVGNKHSFFPQAEIAKVRLNDALG